MAMNTLLPILRIDKIEPQPPHQQWMIRFLWTRSAVGIIGGAPKCCKSWLGLDMAVSVATNTPCLGRFEVETPGPVLVYLAEDALTSVRDRIDSLCASRNRNLEDLDIHVITAPTLRLDLDDDQRQLHNTLEALQPKLLVLDPLVRMHRLDENSASDISKLLGFIRELQRSFDVAIVLVHHASKKHHAQPGQTLRGSSDLHAFGDSNAYLARRSGKLTLTLEHRSAKAPDPFEIDLVTSQGGAYLKVASSLDTKHPELALEERVVTFLQAEAVPCSRNAIREALKVNNQRLGEALQSLENNGRVVRSSKGWTFVLQLPAVKKQKANDNIVSPPIQRSLPFDKNRHNTATGALL